MLQLRLFFAKSVYKFLCIFKQLFSFVLWILDYYSINFFENPSKVCTAHPFCWERGWIYNQIFKKREEGLTGPQLLEGGCWERGGDFFQGGVQISHKNKLKSEIFNDKKSL